MGAGAAGWEAGLVLALRGAVATTARLMVALVLTFGVGRVVLGDGAVLADAGDEPAAGSTSLQQVDVVAQRVERLNARFGCSAEGLDEGVVPLHAVVMRGDRVRVTTFEEGWAVHVGDRPGTLVSVCAR